MKISDFPPDAPLCASGKRPFRTQGAAEAALRDAQGMRRNGAENQQRRPGVIEKAVEECPICHWWHMRSGKQVVNARGKRVKARKGKRTQLY